MGKLKYIVAVGIVVILVIVGYYCSIQPKFNNLQGQLVLDYSVRSSEKKGLEIYNLETNKIENILSDKSCSYSDYSLERNKFVVVIETDGFDKIYEYDPTTNELELLIDNKSEFTIFTNVRFAPHKDAISYQMDGKLFLYDLAKKDKTFIANCYGSYSWEDSGNFLLLDKITVSDDSEYSQNKFEIIKYDTQTSDFEVLNEGMNPEISKSNRFIAYSNNDKGKNDILIEDVLTGEEWGIDDRNHIYSYRFSPDERYLAYSRENNSSFSNTLYDVIIWDFKKGKTKRIIRGYSGLPYFDWIKIQK